MSDKLIEETIVLPQKDRVKETINASLEDVGKLYMVAILAKLSFHFEKKLFNKEKEFLKEAHDLHQKTIKSVKCDYTFNMNGVSDPMVYTIDDIPVDLKRVLKSIYQRSVGDEEDEMQKLCYKYDKNRMFVITPVFEKIVRDYWLYD